ncbi:hypothetical protein DD574_29230, partial [Klebsiella pneumoniae]
TVVMSRLAIFCARRMKSALGTAPSRAESACPPPARATAAPTIPPGGAARARAWGEIARRGKPLIPGPVSM